MKKASCLVPAPPSVASNTPGMMPYSAPASVYATSTAFIPLRAPRAPAPPVPLSAAAPVRTFSSAISQRKDTASLAVSRAAHVSRVKPLFPVARLAWLITSQPGAKRCPESSER